MDKAEEKKKEIQEKVNNFSDEILNAVMDIAEKTQEPFHITMNALLKAVVTFADGTLAYAIEEEKEVVMEIIGNNLNGFNKVMSKVLNEVHK